ncbi:hypothetical protein [Candidatus Thiosymbion oneisti]|uniref:hypothetical protein n=1 Tax=Candidatus Thiosymbion oneisti TaxID=589554 RepID=UPI0013FDAB14|nr:hypothetical protein [Candidatus Thiosymbion oneisti]
MLNAANRIDQLPATSRRLLPAGSRRLAGGLRGPDSWGYRSRAGGRLPALRGLLATD